MTNSLYNKNHIESFIPKNRDVKVHCVYEGLNLEQLIPISKNGIRPKEIKLLSVARLIEEKGLVYLLKACKILKDRKVPFKLASRTVSHSSSVISVSGASAPSVPALFTPKSRCPNVLRV